MKRRTFLAAAAIAPAILPRSVFGANKKLNIGFVGMGGQIQGHVRNTLQLGHNVIAFCDVDPTRQTARATGTRTRPAFITRPSGAAGTTSATAPSATFVVTRLTCRCAR